MKKLLLILVMLSGCGPSIAYPDPCIPGDGGMPSDGGVCYKSIYCSDGCGGKMICCLTWGME